MKKTAFLILIIVFFSFLSAASGEETDGKALFIKGKNEFDAGSYTLTVDSLSMAYQRLPVLGDYTLFYLSRAHRELGNLTESNSRIKELLAAYPDSPLKKGARALEINNIIASGNIPDNLQAFESYVRDYHDDYEIKLLFAHVLKSKGKADKAKALFKDVYINSLSISSKIAFKELSDSDVAPQDIVERATNLINAMAFREAESILREALLKDMQQHKRELFKKLGLSLFKQKKYKESAEAYEKAGDLYSKAKALYKAGERDAFNVALKKLGAMGDKRVGSLLISVASAKKRNGDNNGAINLYKDIIAKYPLDAEESLWGIGWTYYQNRDYEKALETFSALYDAYGNSKYLYWKARTLDILGENAAPVYKQLIENGQDFYSTLAYIKTNRKIEGKRHGVEAKGFMPAANPVSQLKGYQSERVDILIEFGMKKEAASELAAIAKKAVNIDELISISLKLQEAGEFGLAINLVTKLPYREAMRAVLYPLAHWQVVTEASEKYGVDPFIILAVMREESRFDHEARSSAGALGLMQLMPQTAYFIDRRIKLNITSNEQIHDVRTNITIGSYYIGSLIKEFGSLPAAVAAYNAGDEVVRKWQKTGNYTSIDEFIEDIPYDETRNFTKRVIRTYFEYLKSSGWKDISHLL